MHEKFEESWHAVEPKLNGYFYRKGCSREDTLDLVQETAVRAWQNFHTLKGNFKPWVFGIAKFVFFDYLRKKKRVDEIEDESVIEDLKQDPGKSALNAQLIRQCLDELDPLDRQCLILHDLEGYNFDEISGMLGISLSNAHYHDDKARKYLRERFPELVNNIEEVESEL